MALCLLATALQARPFGSLPPPRGLFAAVVQQQALRRGPRSARQRPSVLAKTPSTAPVVAYDLNAAHDLTPDYAVGNLIGRGSFAIVYEVTDTRTGVRLAAKKLPKFVHGRTGAQQAALVAAEAATQRALSATSPCVLPLADVRQDSSYFYLLSELCLTDLRSWLAQRGGAPVGERAAAHILRQLLCALAACHRAGVAFRDVKPANLLVREMDASGLPTLALTDFGCCRSTADPQPSGHTSAGTPLYSSPECVHGSGSMESDLWAAGVLLYHLLSGAFPFCDPRHRISQGEYWRRVAEAPINTAGPAWHGVSPGAVALVRAMLDRDCSRRITAADALRHPWITDMASSRRSATPPGQLRTLGNVVPGVPHLAAAPLHTSA